MTAAPHADTADTLPLWKDFWQTAAKENAARRWALARRVGYLEGVIRGAVAALDAGADAGVVAADLRARLGGGE